MVRLFEVGRQGRIPLLRRGTRRTQTRPPIAWHTTFDPTYDPRLFETELSRVRLPDRIMCLHSCLSSRRAKCLTLQTSALPSR